MHRIPMGLAGALLLAASAAPAQSLFRAALGDRRLLRPHHTYVRQRRAKSARRAQLGRGFRQWRPGSAELSARRQRLIDQTIEAEAARHKIDPLLIHAMIHQESGGNPNALSPKGALGVMQLMPHTAQRFGVRDRRDIVASIRAGVKYLVWLLDRYHGDVRLGLAGYNAGEARVDRAGGVPRNRETPNYVRSIEARYLKLARVRGPGRRPQSGTSAAVDEAPGVPLSDFYVYRFPMVAAAPRFAVRAADAIVEAPARSPAQVAAIDSAAPLTPLSAREAAAHAYVHRFAGTAAGSPVRIMADLEWRAQLNSESGARPVR